MSIASSAATITAKNEPAGPAVTLISPIAVPREYPAYPTVAHENMTSGSALSEQATATPIAIPAEAEASLLISVNNSTPVYFPMVLKIVPMSSDANKPRAIAPIASIKYLFRYPLIFSFMISSEPCSLFI